MTNSLAILSDALHDLGDCLSLGLSWYLEKLSDKKQDEVFSYGYRRFSILGAVITSSVLIAGSLLFVYRAIPRIMNPQPTDHEGMIWLAVLGLAFNGLAAYRLHGGDSLNERTVFLHLLEDVLGWFVILVGAVIMMFTGWDVIDPILSIGIAIFVLYNAVKNLISAANIFLQRTPDSQNTDEIKDAICAISGVKEIHDMHLWTMDGQFHILTAHVVILDDVHNLLGIQKIKRDIKTKLRSMGIGHVTLEFESIEENCSPHD